jgi:F420-0:gamma-glutamyl ligase
LAEQKQGTRQEKHELVKQEADQYLPNSYSQYDLMIAVKNGMLAVNAGIDESNANDKYVLWPAQIQDMANQIWQFLRQEFKVQELGVIITDSRSWPLRWGVVGTCLGHCGFEQLHDYRGREDLFGRPIHYVFLNIAEAIASAAALEMGEVDEQTPLCVVEDIPHIKFQNQPPTQAELKKLKIPLEDDVYGPFLNSVDWVKKE